MKMLSRFVALLGILAVLIPGTAAAQTSGAAIQTLLQPSASPLVTFRILFKTGAARDPQGREGVAALTAALLAKGGSKGLAYEEIVRQMYPIATSFDWQVDKEMTVFSGACHVETLETYYGLIRQMLLEPGFRESDFSRLKTDATDFLKVSLRDGNDEELAKEELYNLIYAGHPYGHHNMGTLDGLEKTTLEDVRAFYAKEFTQVSPVVGLAGGYPKDFPDRLRRDFSALPKGEPNSARYAKPAAAEGIKVEIIERETRSTAISLGFPIGVRRGDKDWPALALVSSYLGQHRSSNSHLYQRLRELRGLNYGDYSYIEYFPRGMFQFQPDANMGRQQQIFQIWVRPVPPAQAHFALRAALYEFDKLLKEGLSQQDFESTRQFLTKFAGVLTQTDDSRLGYALDSQYYGTKDFVTHMKEELGRLTLEEVNAALRRHLRRDSLQIVMVTKDGAGLKKALVGNAPSPVTYNSPKPPEVMEEDKVIQAYPIQVKAEDVKVVPADRVFVMPAR